MPTAPVSVFLCLSTYLDCVCFSCEPFVPCVGQVQTQVEHIDEKHNVSGKIAAVAMSAQAKVQEVDTK